jgi:hypothetical protein
LSNDPRESVIDFLLEAKRAIQSNEGGWIFSTRPKNTETMALLELNTADLKQVVLTLSVIDYCDGPLDDPVIKGEVWIFGKVIGGREIYIKLKLWGDKRNRALRVLSFHTAEKPLTFRFRD